MQSGKLGIVVLILAIVGTILGSWAMSMDVEEIHVTKYNQLADITGEFDKESTPEYILYNPSTNYTGYYTDNSIMDDTRYFDGVDYASSEPNNYRLNLMPIVNDSDTYTLDDTFTSERPPLANFRLYYAYGQVRQIAYCDPDYISLDNLYAELGATLDEIRIKCVSSAIDWSDPESDWITFGYSSAYTPSAGGTGDKLLCLKNPTISGQIIGNSDYMTNANWVVPALSCIYNVQTQSVQLFADNDYTNSLGIYDPTDVRLIWQHDGDNNATLEIGTQAVIVELDLQNPSYMDPSKGVELNV